VSPEVVVPIDSEADIVLARQKARELAARCGFSSTDQTIVALAVSEIARNIVSYARSGRMLFAILERDTRRGIQVIAEDQGPGIPDIQLAMRDGYSTARSLGMGLPGAKRVMDEFELRSTPGSGTTVTMAKWSR
jgi:serine/threonine-protein kinase RsbT